MSVKGKDLSIRTLETYLFPDVTTVIYLHVKPSQTAIELSVSYITFTKLGHSL